MFALENVVFFPSSTRFIVVSLYNLEKKKTTLTLPKGVTIYKTLVFAIDFPHYNHIYKKIFANILCY
jgi:hypothetical protein